MISRYKFVLRYFANVSALILAIIKQAGKEQGFFPIHSVTKLPN